MHLNGDGSKVLFGWTFLDEESTQDGWSSIQLSEHAGNHLLYINDIHDTRDSTKRYKRRCDNDTIWRVQMAGSTQTDFGPLLGSNFLCRHMGMIFVVASYRG